ncbi:MAG: branched-chain amino acid ABC transporter permease [Thermovirgaceae bacterium]|jgi:branched-chain amino acid transport system permease protein|nr:branched-chain amino acid ABC transporter permease [Synergistales bacterium]MDI9392735.1 branched-chain amino acid ABC transporter permease [Synergistota bacterium]MDY0179148.1 branched-chain amino acid ABC transporter permease [Synergistaceae bacterium]HRW87840.1 branched-chain amino acid ABC transporter permease [Thermovirgaceae bacterium]MDD3133414.1 branched-chain amino acid ABC transporter permease [Synergistales bacterium]
MSGYLEGIIILICINSIAAMGVSLLTGFTGIFTLGHAGYMAIGAYTAAILTVRHHVPWLVAVLAAGTLAMVIAYLIGVPTLKLMGDYFAIASIGLGETIRLILENWQSFTRGARGFPGIANYTTLPVAAAFFLGMLVLMRFLINGNYGRAFKACRDDFVAASLLGFKTAHYRVLSLAISGFYCGIAGGLMAGFLTYLQPIMFDMQKSTELTAVVVFGGLGSLSGSIIGTTVIGIVTEVFRPISQYRMLIYGAIMVIIMVARPEGIMGQHEVGPKLFRSLFSRKTVNEGDGANG